MKNADLKADGSVNSNPIKDLEEKVVANFHSRNHTVNDFGKDPQANTRLGIVFDWSKETMIVQAYK